MSTLPDNDFDLEKLFLPAWAQEEPSSAKYDKYEGEIERPDRRENRRGPRPPRRGGQPGGRREGLGRGPRPPRTGEDRRPEGRRAGGPGERGRGPRGRPDQARPHREPPPPLPEINLALVPEEKGVESLARQIKMTGRAYPLFEIAQMILAKPERHSLVFEVKKKEEGQPVQPLFLCALDDTLWLSEDEAVAHILRKHFSTFYQADRTATEPPKGKYTFVAQCGMSGVILGPPNYHDYQNQLRKLHNERYSRMPFEVYKSRVRIVRDEEVVKKWVEDQSWKTEYICLNVPEPVRLLNMEAVEKHFRETHKENIIKQVESYTLTGTAARNLRSPDLARLARSFTEDQRRFPLQIATVLSQQFAKHGLQFFKVNKTVTHVAVARPHYLDLALTPVSEGVKRIVEYINNHPKTNRRDLVEALAPTPSPTAAPPVPQPAAEAQPAAEGQPVAEAQAAPEAQPPAAPQEPGPTSEQTAVIADLHWLIHQGHVIEFATGVLETARKPAPKPPKPEPKAKAPETAAVEPATNTEGQAALSPAAPEGQAPAAEAATAETPASPETAAAVPESPVAPAEPSSSAVETTVPPAESPAPAAEPNPEPPAPSAETPSISESPSPAAELSGPGPERAPVAEPSADTLKPEPERQPEAGPPAAQPAEPPGPPVPSSS